ncbi:hypothetical protein [Pandoraea pulmonicola]|uniref:Uncharacterized protein n=1 Tax=Pandoraea pulmonicola TaxID=93221 RepID=A0AAJ5D012_PANPU|nr:hypothetical protein [Pandoraea pulmonicola]AJC21072.1 hypothetical protein RO07_12460 [Pandoraea pulmonicola]SUA90276.1 Uncharacterised protein [Pandoraea pulmonicola]
MSKLSKTLFLSCVILMASIQVSATLLIWTAWPITSFDVFGRAPKEIWILKAVITNDQGDEEAVDPGQTLPVEFFKARSIYARTFLGAASPAERDGFARRLLGRLNKPNWVGVDETFPPLNIAKPTGLRVEAWELDADHLDSGGELAILRRRLIYQLLPQPASPN